MIIMRNNKIQLWNDSKVKTEYLHQIKFSCILNRGARQDFQTKSTIHQASVTCRD